MYFFKKKLYIFWDEEPLDLKITGFDSWQMRNHTPRVCRNLPYQINTSYWLQWWAPPLLYSVSIGTIQDLQLFLHGISTKVQTMLHESKISFYIVKSNTRSHNQEALKIIPGRYVSILLNLSLWNVFGDCRPQHLVTMQNSGCKVYFHSHCSVFKY